MMTSRLILFLICHLLLSSNTYGAPFEDLISPGDLVESHKKYENECAKCHLSFNKSQQNQLCLDCHKEIKSDVQKKRGLHGNNKAILDDDCKYCHTDHVGRKTEIVIFDENNFDHSLAGYNLEGRHKNLACFDCHNKKKKFREASPSCNSCHKEDDYHQKKLGDKCENCHSEKSWKKTKFDHSKTDYELKLSHEKVFCLDCHPNQNYKDTPTQCNYCHQLQDVHEGQLGTKCDKCHQSGKWNKNHFKHDKVSKFKLKNLHKTTSCFSCHVNGNYKKELKSKCVSCHIGDDIHNGIYGKKCNNCHSDKEWKNGKFNHNKKSDFKLEFVHKEVKCQSCHQTKINLDEARSLCFDCHEPDDIHNKNLGEKCDQCHDQRNWILDIQFDHDISNFPLNGLHAIVLCDGCHKSNDYQLKKSSCYDCHKKDDSHKLALSPDCSVCHSANGWLNWSFDHTKQTDYPLRGTHQEIECGGCHKIKVNRIKDIELSNSCVSCHKEDDVHEEKFGHRCENCHNETAFNKLDKINE